MPELTVGPGEWGHIFFRFDNHQKKAKQFDEHSMTALGRWARKKLMRLALAESEIMWEPVRIEKQRDAFQRVTEYVVWTTYEIIPRRDSEGVGV